jgi:hypothetical protein
MNKNRYFCTLFDSNYLLKGVVMLTSLVENCPSAHIFVLCMDARTHHILSELKLPGVELLELSEVEDADLLRVKPGRSIAEYCWTLSAALCWFVMQARLDVRTLTYLDADLMFFSDVEPIFQEIGEASIAIIEHRFIPRLSHLVAYGRFNVEWVSFVRNEVGIACLKKWRDQCIDWCFARLEDGKLGDQKYLDDWPKTYAADVHIIQHKGAGVAPWNFSNYQYTKKDDTLFVDEVKLIFYHFHQFQLLRGGRFYYMSDLYAGDSILPTMIYEAYVKRLEQMLTHVRQFDGDFSAGIRSSHKVQLRRLVQRFLPSSLKGFIRKIGVHMW